MTRDRTVPDDALRWLERTFDIVEALPPEDVHSIWRALCRSLDVQGPVRGSLLDARSQASELRGRGARKRCDLLLSSSEQIYLLTPAYRGVGWAAAAPRLPLDAGLRANAPPFAGDLIVVGLDMGWAYVAGDHEGVGEALISR